MGSYDKLYLANNLESLNLLAQKDCDVKKFKIKFIYDNLRKLYKESQANVLDQEKTYILLYRYLSVYNHLLSLESDKVFVKLRYGSECEKVLLQFEGLKKSLEERYALNTDISPEPAFEDKQVAPQDKPQYVFDEEFITCQQLYRALQEQSNMLIVDARPANDFNESHINYPNCINVPDEIITAGLSANVLGKKLPEQSQQMWDKRDSFTVIILYDWNTCAENFAVTKLSKLHAALVEWDLNRNYSEKPVILTGGYLEMLQTYPTICVNPFVYLSQKNTELDELLELDNITYPIESDNTTNVMGTLEEKTSVNKPKTTEQPIIEETESDIKRDEILNKLEHERNESQRIKKMCNTETSINKIANLKQREHELLAEISRLESLLQYIDEKQDKSKAIESNTRLEVDYEVRSSINQEPEIRDDSEKLKEFISEERNKELVKARALKPKSDGDGNFRDFLEKSRPVINRATKPTAVTYSKIRPIPESEMVSGGLTGLRNIRNTCYMNTLLQCLRNIPDVKTFFCKGIYAKYIIRHPAAIIHETAAVVRKLSTKSSRPFDPHEFYEKIGQLEPVYKLGNHEDCMEFFLFLLNQLSEDCRYDVPLPPVLTPRQRAWYNQFQGKNSIFIDRFYHQIRITQHCLECGQSTYKFEIESTFMLPIPEHDFTLDMLLDEYMKDYVISDYCCSKCKKPVNNEKELIYEPKIMVIVLKRYRQDRAPDGTVIFSKIEAKASFEKRSFRLNKHYYDLNAIALHSGNMNHGHYTAVALTSKGWYEFNDEEVRPININDESLKSKACAFFYSRCDGE